MFGGSQRRRKKKCPHCHEWLEADRRSDENVQEKLNESVLLKKEALAKISEAEKFAEDLEISSKKENKILNDSIMAQCEVDLENLIKQASSVKDFEQRKMVRIVVEDVLAETLNQSSDGFDKEAMANVILKKVA